MPTHPWGRELLCGWALPRAAVTRVPTARGSGVLCIPAL